MTIVVDHVRGARRGQRQVFDVRERVTFGRHPDNDVAFDGNRDIDASTRHAEILRDTEAGVTLLRDLGSSNGTWVDGHKVAESPLSDGGLVFVEFGRGGPMVRVWMGSSADEAPAPPRLPARWRRFLPW